MIRLAHPIRLAIAVLIAAAACCAFAASRAEASTPCSPAADLLSIFPGFPNALPAPTQASCFEGFDGDQTVPSSGHTGHFDWQQIVANPTAFNFQSIKDDTGDSSFTGGDKENDPGAWTLDPNGSVQGKVDVVAAASATDPVSNKTFVYGAFQRAANNGDVFLSFELNKNPPPANGFFPARSEGDVLITFDGNQGSIVVSMCKWHGNAQGESSDPTFGWYSLPGFGAGGVKAASSTGCTQLSGTAAPAARGEINGTSIPNYIPNMGAAVTLSAHTQSGSNSITSLSSTAGLGVGEPVTGAGIPANTTVASIVNSTSITISNNATATGNNVSLTFGGTNAPNTIALTQAFGEVIVNLSDALQAGGAANPCFDFGSIWVHTRASHSFANQMEDLVQARPLVGAKSCAIAVDKKVATQSQGGPAPLLTTTGDTTSGSPTITNLPSTTNLQVGSTVRAQGVPAGSTIQSKTLTSITLSNNATATATGVTLAIIAPGAYHEGTVADPSTAIVGDTLNYLLTVTNPGQTPISQDTITDSNCSPEPPTLVSKVEGPNDTGANMLDPGDVWTYSCTRPVAANDTSPINNTVTTTGHVGAAVCPDANNPACVSANDTVSTSILGRVKIVKQSLPSGDPTEFDYTSPAPSGGNGVTGLDQAQLHDGESAGFFPVAAGSYTVAEDAKTGWDLTGLSCDDSGQSQANRSSTDLNSRTATFNVQPGEDVTCTFTNTKRATLAIHKTAIGGSANFDFTTSDSPATNISNLASGTTSTAQSVPPGNYTFTETAKTGWNLTALSCDDSGQANVGDRSTTSVPNATATFNLQPGENVVCTYTNTKKGSVAIHKTAVGGTGNFDYTTSDTGVTNITGLASGSTSTAQSVVPGTYTFTETAKTGWDLTAISCDDSAQGAGDKSTFSVQNGTATFNVQPGEDVVCTFTNTKRATLAIHKTAIGGSANFDYTTSDTPATNISNLASGTTSSTQSVPPGSYTYTETAKTGWDLTALSCDDSGQANVGDRSTTSVPNATATFNLQPGENVICTYTNTKQGSVAIHKTAIGGSGNFDYTTSDTGVTNISNLASGTTSSAQSVVPGSYTFHETTKAGWDLTDLSCDDSGQANPADRSTTSVQNGTATFNVQPGENVVCTFTNTKRAGIAIHKTAIGGSGNFDFTTADSPATDISNLASGTTSQTQSVPPGNYTFHETGKTGWDLTDVSCDDSGQANPADQSTTDLNAGTATFNLQAGETVVCTFTNTKRGSVAIHKTTVGGSGNFDFTTNDTGVTDVNSLASGTTSTPQSVVPGSYTFAETAKTGWDLTDLSCDDSGQANAGDRSTTDLNAGTATFNVQPGENVICTYTNTKRATLAIHKTAIGGSGNFDYTTSSLGATDINNLASGTTSATQSVIPGSYTFTETPKTGWDLTDLSCDDSGQAMGLASTTDLNLGSATFNLQPGENVVCTFTNTKRGSVAIHKTTIGGSGNFDFTTNDTGVTDVNNLASGTTSTPQLVQPGTYTFAEAAKAGWDLTALSCDDSGQANAGDRSTTNLGAGTATFNVQPGEDVICTFTNTKQATLAIHKTAIGGSGNFDFTTSDTPATDISNLASGTTSSTQSVPPGSYTFAETAKAGWDLTDLSCDDSGQQNVNDRSTTDLNAGTATFDLQPGENVICTFTNTKRAGIAIHKTAIGGSGTFDFTTADSPATDISNLQSGTTSQTQSVPPGNYTFHETGKTGWDLTGVSCDDSGQASAGDRSTTDLNAGTATFNLQAGETVVCTFTNTKQGSVAIHKTTVGGSGNFDFTTSDSGVTDVNNLASGSTSTPQSVVPGSYTFHETAKSGWDLTDLSCDDANQANAGDRSTTDLNAGTATFNVQPGEDVICTYTNTKQATLAIHKTAIGGSGNFDYTTSDSPATDINNLASGSTSTTESVPPGSYTFHETAKTGWDLTDLSCDDSGQQNQGDRSTTDLNAGTATFNLQPGENVICTFTNTKEGTVAIHKTTVGGSGTFDFTTSSQGVTDVNNLQSGTTSTPQSVAPGTYTFHETGKSGWDLTGISCDDANQQNQGDQSTTDLNAGTATFNVQPGEDVVCTFTNTAHGHVIIKKVTDPSGGADQFAFDPGSLGGGTFDLTDQQTKDFEVSPNAGGAAFVVTEASHSGYRLTDVSCLSGNSADSDSSGSVPNRTASIHVDPGETVTCTFTNKLINSGTLVVKVGDDFAYHGDTIHFGYTVTNTGNGPLHDIVLTDDKCPNVQGPTKKDSGGNADPTPDTLDPGDVWTYTCSSPVPPHTAGEENPIVNTATVTGKDEFDRQVSDTDQHSTQILHPAIAIDKTGPANATQGDLISYNLTVTNPGDQSFADANVHVTDQQCTTPVTLVVKNRGGGLDPTPGTLDPGDSWVYACSAQTSVGQTRLDNIGSVTGTDSHGHTVNAQDTATTVLGEQVVAGQEILPGQAKLAGKSGCVAKAFTVKVSGRSIDRVVITIDGKRKAILHASGTNGKTVKFKVDPRKFKPGSHLLVAKTYFTADTGTKPKTLKLRFSRCIRRTAPAFTG